MAANARPPQSGHDNPIHAAGAEASPDTFRSLAEAHWEAEAVMETAGEAIKKTYADPIRLAEFIESMQTPVYILKWGLLSRFCLWVLGFQAGFIPPSSGFRHRLLRSLLKFHALLPGARPGAARSAADFQHGCIVLLPKLFTFSFLSYQLHHWLACRAGLHGYDAQAQALYRKFWNEQRGQLGADVALMSEADILALRAAIHRDLEALCFLRRMMQDLPSATHGQQFSSQKSA